MQILPSIVSFGLVPSNTPQGNTGKRPSSRANVVRLRPASVGRKPQPAGDTGIRPRASSDASVESRSLRNRVAKAESTLAPIIPSAAPRDTRARVEVLIEAGIPTPELETLVMESIKDDLPTGMKLAAACRKKGMNKLAEDAGETAARTHGTEDLYQYIKKQVESPDNEELIIAWKSLSTLRHSVRLTSKILASGRLDTIKELLPDMLLTVQQGQDAMKYLFDSGQLDKVLPVLFSKGRNCLHALDRLGPEYSVHKQAVIAYFLDRCSDSITELEGKLTAIIYGGSAARERVKQALSILNVAKTRSTGDLHEVQRQVKRALDKLEGDRAAALTSDEQQRLRDHSLLTKDLLESFKESIISASSSEDALVGEWTVRKLVRLLTRCSKARRYSDNCSKRLLDSISQFAGLFLLDRNAEALNRFNGGLKDLYAVDIFKNVVSNCAHLQNLPGSNDLMAQFESATEWTEWAEVSSETTGPLSAKLYALGEQRQIKKLQQLSPGQRLMLPLGWSGNRFAHAMYGLLQCQSAGGQPRYGLSVANAGIGADNHASLAPPFSRYLKRGIDFSISEVSSEDITVYLKTVLPLSSYTTAQEQLHPAKVERETSEILNNAAALGAKHHYQPLNDLITAGRATRSDTGLSSRTQLGDDCTVAGLKRMLRLLVASDVHNIAADEFTTFDIESRALVYAMWGPWLGFVNDKSPEIARDELAKRFTKYMIRGIAKSSPQNAVKILAQMHSAGEKIPGKLVQNTLQGLCTHRNSVGIMKFVLWLSAVNPVFADDAVVELTKTGFKKEVDALKPLIV